jgi:ABC-type transporter Mla subunit MlaD
MTDPTIIAFPERAEDRLRHALRRLDEALAEQRAAVGAWRGELGQLAEATARLDGSLRGFRDNLQHLAVAARDVDQEVKRLDRTADLMMRLEGKG